MGARVLSAPWAPSRQEWRPQAKRAQCCLVCRAWLLGGLLLHDMALGNQCLTVMPL